MRRRSKKDKENKSIESDVLSKLKTIEKRIDAIELSLKGIDASSFLASEDQLFFGFVLSLVLLIIQLPDVDVCTLFESWVKIEPTRGIITTKAVFTAFLILASIVRYSVTLAKEAAKRNILRLFSVILLLTSFYFLMTDLFMRGLGALLKNLNVSLLFVPPAAIMLFAILFGNFIEKKWVRHYGYHEPWASITFAFLGLLFLVTYGLGTVIGIFIPISEFVVLLILIASAFITFLVFKFSNEVYKRLKNSKLIRCLYGIGN